MFGQLLQRSIAFWARGGLETLRVIPLVSAERKDLGVQDM